MHTCEYCGRDGFKSIQGLNGHVRMVHSGAASEEPRRGLGDPLGRAEGRPPENRFFDLGRAAGRPAEIPLQSPPWYESTDKMDELARNAALAARLKLDENPQVQSYLAKIGFNVEKAFRAAIQVVANQLKADNGEFANAGDVPTMEAFDKGPGRRPRHVAQKNARRHLWQTG